MARKLSQIGIDLIKSFEGLKLSPYLDIVGVPTIGYGTTFYEDGSKVTINDAIITEDRAQALLAAHLDSFCAAVEKAVHVPLTDNQFAAIVSWTYNVGPGNMASSTLVKDLNNKDYTNAADEFDKWNKAGGQVSSGLTRRRQAEKSLFLHNPAPTSQSQLPDIPSDEDILAKLEDSEKGS